MPKEFHRTDRVGEALQMELAMMLSREVKDPRFMDLTVTEVRVSRDMSHAKVYVSFLDNDADHVKQTMKALDKAAGFFRSQLSQRMTMRSVPSIHFKYDDSFERGSKLTSLIESAIENDRKDVEPDQ